MTGLLRPFTGFVPTSLFGGRVVGPPKVLLLPGRGDAGVDDPLSFRYSVGRGAGPSADVAASWLNSAVQTGALQPVRDAVVVHAAERGGRTALGMLADVSIDAYTHGAVKAHEKTVASNEQKMVGYMLLTRIFGNPVVLAQKSNVALSARLVEHSARPVDAEFDADDGTHHRLWFVVGEQAEALVDLVASDLYIADGHHRLEAARALAHAERRANAWFPAGLYVEDQFEVWAFARGVRGGAMKGNKLIARLRDEFELTEVDAAIPRPSEPHSFGTRIAGQSFVLKIPADRVVGDAYDRLDPALLQQLILAPLLGIDDPRRDDRLEVVADSGDAAHNPDDYQAWFLPYPTPASDVMAVADLGRTMPPKSTYFLPKLPGGIVIRSVD